tara:strand:- start:2693 stop:3535 length:843 start_codon:yes stop_codon:yes gene_type:complete
MVDGIENVSPNASGFAHGVGLFETCALVESKAAFFDEHWERLAASAASLGLPFEYDKTEVVFALCEFLEQATNADDSALKLTLYEDAPGHTKLIWNLRAKRKLSPEVRTRLNLSSQQLNEHAELTGHKTLNYWPNRRGLERATQAGVLDALVLNTNGVLAECWASNVFIIKEGVAYTPPLDDGPLPGVVRRIIRQEALRNGIEMDECSITLEDVSQAEAVFVTNSLIGIQEITQIELMNTRTWSAAQTAHPIIEKLKASYASALAKSISMFGPRGEGAVR